MFSACNAQNKAQNFDWKEFVSDEGKFKVTFPVVPTKSVKETAGGISKVQSTRFEVSLLEPEIYFGVLYADFPTAPSMNQEALRAYYDKYRDALQKASDAELISERDIYVNGNLGRELVLKSKKQIIVTQQNYLIGTRSFQVMTTAKSSLMENAKIKKDVNKFLDSFQFIEK